MQFVRVVADGAGIAVAAGAAAVEALPSDVRGVLIGVAALAARQVALILIKWMQSKFGGGRRTNRNRRSRLLNKNKTETL